MIREALSIVSLFFYLAAILMALGLYIELRRVLVGKERAQVNFGGALVGLSIVILVAFALLESWIHQINFWWLAALADVFFAAGVAFFLLGVLRFVMQVRRGTRRNQARKSELPETREVTG